MVVLQKLELDLHLDDYHPSLISLLYVPTNSDLDLLVAQKLGLVQLSGSDLSSC